MNMMSKRPVLVLCFICVLAVLAACAPRIAGTGDSAQRAESDVDDSSELSITWTTALDCSECHGIEAHPTNDGAVLAADHSERGLSCTSCHEESDKMLQAHQNMSSGAVATRLKKTVVDPSVCAPCHASETLSAATSMTSVLTDKNGLTVNPHDLPANDDHAKVDCVDCHSMHAETPVDSQAVKKCQSCHHQGVYECYTCHE
jgi:hypothetical protein